MQTVINNVKAMANNHQARQMATKQGLAINTVSWEDCARSKNSSWGPCISDMTLQVDKQRMPVIRAPNFTDTTWDVEMDKIPVVVGNHDGNPGAKLTTVSLRQYLENLNDYMTAPPADGKKLDLIAKELLGKQTDKHVIMSSQCCFLPIEKGKETKFSVALFNYQSKPKDPAVLVIVSTSKGTSAQVVEGRDQELVFNNYGQKADFIGQRLTDNRIERNVSVHGAMTKQEKQDNCIVVIQVPLKQKPKEVHVYKSYNGYGNNDLFGGFGAMNGGGGGYGYQPPQQSQSMNASFQSFGGGAPYQPQMYQPQMYQPQCNFSSYSAPKQAMAMPESSSNMSFRKAKSRSIKPQKQKAEVEAAIVKIAPKTVPICSCGGVLEKVSIAQCYPTTSGGVVCDGCGEAVTAEGANTMVWHCPKEKTSYKHRNGYDLCLACGIVLKHSVSADALDHTTVPIAPPFVPPRSWRRSGRRRQKSKKQPIRNDIVLLKPIERPKLHLDLSLLQYLWAESTDSKSRKCRIKNKKKNKAREFAVFDADKYYGKEEGQRRRESRLRMLMTCHFLKHGVFEQRVHDMLHPEQVTDEEYLMKIQRVLPSENERLQFQALCDGFSQKEADSSFAFLERVWFRLKDTPHIADRCEMVLLSRSVDAFCAAHQETTCALQESLGRLCGNQQIRTIAELVLFIGNYINFRHIRLSNAKGFQWQSVLGMAQSFAVGADNYSLLMFLVENVHRNHPSLINWVDAFAGLDVLSAGDEEIETQMALLQRRLEKVAYQRGSNSLYDEAVLKLQRFEEQYRAAAEPMTALPAYFGFADERSRYSELRQVCALLVQIRREWRECEERMRIPIFAVYDHIVVAYFRDSAVECGAEMPSDIIGSINAFLSLPFKRDLLCMYGVSEKY